MKVREIFWNTKIQLSFKSSSAAALIKKLSGGKFIKFFGTSGPSFWIRTNCRRFGQRGVENKSHKTPSFIVTKFLPCKLFATGMSNMYTVCPEEQFKVQTPLRNWNNYKLNWTNSWKMFKVWEKIHGVGAKIFKQRCWNRNIHVHVFFAKSIFLRQTFIFENLLDFNKKYNSTRSEDFFGRSLFLSHLVAKSRPSSELRLVKKLPFDSKVWRKTQFFLFDRGITMEKLVQRHSK